MKRKIKYKITNITRRMVKGYQNFLKMVYPEWSRAKIRAKTQRHFYWRFMNVPQKQLFFTSNSGIGVLDHDFADQGILSIKSCDSSYADQIVTQTGNTKPNATRKHALTTKVHHRYKLSPTGLNPWRNHPFDNLVLPEKSKAVNFDTYLSNFFSVSLSLPEEGDFIRDDEALNELRLTPVSVDGMDTNHAPVLKLDVSYDYAATPSQGETLPLTDMPPPFDPKSNWQ